MYPSLLAEETKRAVTEYLTTTFALADDDVRAALEGFLVDPDRGIFAGPYLRVRTPFRQVEESWTSPLSWMPTGLTPYRHQARAFERLSTRDQPAQPTIVTTGTGSGKTEAFLVPLLDHAKRARERGETGIKAILLYPMNALVTDQAGRIARMLNTEPALAGVTAGVYIGGKGLLATSTATALADDRDALRASPPDLLLTNYKMLDLLLLRPADKPLWDASRTSLQFVVLDEFHTYDGAQGTDVAMLLRRLGATLRVGEPGRPLGRMTPVATSATLGSGSRSNELRHFAETVFGTPFGDDSLINEDRLTADEIVTDVDHAAGVPLVERLAPRDANEEAELARAVDADHGSGWRALAQAALLNDTQAEEGDTVPVDAVALGEVLSRRIITLAVLRTLAGSPRSPAEAVEHLARGPVWPWGVSNKEDPERTERALMRYLALLSAARRSRPDGSTQPLVQFETQLWVRELSRMIRAVAVDPAFAWWHDGVQESDQTWMPAVHCRSCGHSGWMAVVPEVGETMIGAPRKVWHASLTFTGRARTRALLRTDADDPAAQWLSARSLELGDEARDGWVPVVVTPSDEAAQEQRCPSCGANDTIRFLGSSVSTLASVTLTSQFGSHLVPTPEKKTLVFTDSVQDAAHRAAYIEGRAYAFNLRSAMVDALEPEGTAIHLVAERLGRLDDADKYAVTPPDFVRRLGLEGEWLQGTGGRRVRALLERRLGCSVQLEAGLNARTGRTLELTGTASVDVDTDVAHLAQLVRETHANLPQLALADLPEAAVYERWLLGLLERVRTQGGIADTWLTAYMRADGKRWSIWGGSLPGMPKFPRGRPAPAFWTTGRDPGLDSLTPQGESWLTSWTSRVLGVGLGEAKALLPAAAGLLAGESGPLISVFSAKGNTVYGLDHTRVIMHPVHDVDLADGSARLRCDACDHVQPAPPGRLEVWLDGTCPRLRCGGLLRPAPERVDNFYRSLYRSGRVRRIVTHEHTGLLTREVREDVERRFRAGTSPVDPNILTCTPTLELGIDIGELSTVTLSSLPRATANYLQRVGRAGRSTGNAFVVATVPSAPRDLYYFAEPLHLIDGDVLPPGAYLNATEILQRQYFAYCLDRVADGTLAIGPMPNLLGGVLGKHLAEGEWLRTFVDLVVQRADQLAESFLSLYGDHLDQGAIDALAAFAREGLPRSVARVVTEWLSHRDSLDERILGLVDAISELQQAGHRDDEQEAELKRWKGELGALRSARSAMGRAEALSGLVELGLLPNYLLLDDATTLDVQLWWTTDDSDDASRFQRVEHSIARGSRAALTELAPGASFYVFGSKIKIDALDLGATSRPSWSILRLCPECGHGADTDGVPAGPPCPRCGSAHYADAGSRHAVLPLRRVSAVHHRDDVVLDDESDERVRTRFAVVTGVSVAPQDVVRAWRLKDVPFGAEYVRNATIRSVNVGRAEQAGAGQAVIAGETVAAPGFLTCTTCGVVAEDPDDEQVRHRGWCASRRGDVEWQRLLLSHELSTQAVRMLLPLSTLHVQERLASFATSLQLGLRLDFGGDPQHLSVTTATLPDAERRPRQFVVLHDLVPGGTGYLDRFGRPERLRTILTKARDHLDRCSCRLEGRKSCHRCLLGLAPSRWTELVDRALALDLLSQVLDSWEPEELASVVDIDISTVELSELEQRFRELLKAWTGQHEADGHACTVGYGPAGEELDLRLRHGDEVRRWRVVQQQQGPHEIRTLPDLTCTRQDAQEARVAIYLDGKAYHASPEFNRTADDARKRDELRQHGYRVWSITWDDVEAFEKALAGRPAEPPTFLSPQARAAVDAAVPDPRGRVLRGNPVDSLLAYLTDPTSEVWGATAEQSVLAVMQHGTGAPVPVTSEAAQGALLELARGHAPTPPAGNILLVPRRGVSGLPIHVVGTSDGDGTTALGVLAVLDDADSVVGTPEHDAHWRDWLRWANVLQFLIRPRHGDERPQRMAALWTTRSLDVFAQELLPVVAGASRAPMTDIAMPDAWQIVIDFVDPAARDLAQQLGADGIVAPEVGAEVAEGSKQVELAWEDRRVAVIIDTDEDRDSWLAQHGWQVFHVSDEPLKRLVAALKETS